MTLPATSGELSVFSGIDAYYNTDHNFTELRYTSDERIQIPNLGLNVIFNDAATHEIPSFEIGWSGVIGTDNTIGGDVFVTNNDWLFGLGVEHSRADDIVGTAWKYQIRIEYEIVDNLSVGLVHKSNCNKVCEEAGLFFLPRGPKDLPNSGYNYVGLRWTVLEF